MTITYAGPSVSSTFAAGLINDAWADADLFEAEAAIAGATADSAVPVLVEAPRPDVLTTKLPAVDALVDNQWNLIDADWATRGPRLVAARASLITDTVKDAKYFISTYFNDPMDGSSVSDQAMTWIDTILLQGGTGVAAETAIRVNDVARISADSLRAAADLNNSWAVRGIVLPDRALTYQQRNVDIISGDVQGEAERTARIASWMGEVETTAWSIGRALQLRSDAIERCRAYITEWLKIRYDRANQREMEPIEHLKAMQESYYKYMQQELAMRDTAVDRYLTGYGDQKTKWTNKEALKLALYKARVKSLEERAQSLGTRAAGRINAVHVGASASASESV